MATPLGALSGIPGLSGFLSQRQLAQGEEQAQLGQLGALAQLQGQLQQQQARTVEANREAQARQIISNLGPEATTADFLKALRPVSNPDKLLPLLQGEENRRMGVEANKEAARGRLQQAGRDLEFRYEKMRSDAKTDQQRLNIDAMYKAAKTAIDAEGLKLTGARVFYETGERPNIDLTGIYSAPQQGGAQAQPPATAVPAGGMGGGVPPPAGAVPRELFPRGAAAGENPQAQLSILQSELANARQNEPDAVPAIEREIARVSGARVPVAPQAPMPVDTELRRFGPAPVPQPAQVAQAPSTQGITPVGFVPPSAAPAPASGDKALPDWINAIKSPKMRAETATRWRMEQEKEGATGSRITQTQIVKGLEDNYSRLRDAPQALANIEKAKELIPSSKLFQGSLGEQKLAAAKFFNNNLGMSIDMAGVQSAEELRSRVFFNIMDNLKKMDAQPSQLQQQIMQDALGKLGTDPSALANILDAFGDVIRDKVSAYDKQVGEAATAKINWPHKITIPPKSGRAATAVREFNSEAEAAAAGIPPGTKVKINGVSGTWR